MSPRSHARTPRTYVDGTADAPLFGPGSDLERVAGHLPDVDADLGMVQPQRADGDTRGGKTVAAVAWAFCPYCTGDDDNGRGGAALVPGGAHLLWRPHDVVTTRGTRVPCRATGVALCQLGSHDGVMTRKATSAERGTTGSSSDRVRVPARCRCGVEPAARPRVTTSTTPEQSRGTA